MVRVFMNLGMTGLLILIIVFILMGIAYLFFGDAADNYIEKHEKELNKYLRIPLIITIGITLFFFFIAAVSEIWGL